jgi:ribosome-interacting GTPase 1
MPINAHPDYLAAEKEYETAIKIEDKIEKLKKMISVAPKHKSSEKLLANLKTRLKKLQEKSERGRKSGKTNKIGIKKEDMQAAIIGMSNSGKSSLLNNLTNAQPKISDNSFATTYPIIGMMAHNGVSIQLIEIPAIESEYYDRGLVNTADAILIIVENLQQINEIKKVLEKSYGKQLIIFNKIDQLSENEKRKISANLASKKYNFVMISNNTQEGYDELKNKIFECFDKIRIFTKEPGKKASNRPIILEPETTVEEVAEKILKGFSKRVKETKIWGPSSKFPGQKVGLKHKLKDMDIVEFKTV